jgi:hypothetical protein
MLDQGADGRGDHFAVMMFLGLPRLIAPELFGAGNDGGNGDRDTLFPQAVSDRRVVVRPDREVGILDEPLIVAERPLNLLLSRDGNLLGTLPMIREDKAVGIRPIAGDQPVEPGGFEFQQGQRLRHRDVALVIPP